ncbi:MAG: hypothetical protein HN929_06135 [Chloroflexi bacterium]|jgi:hypothetical protein|nr:hypothetical protein [Chloroflexota bacterium]MBT7081028.1 hypothetical protein [Chloroflexota bacterium]MBT7289201.1 hypothetical protein [Chloroflexota bacterium]
MPMQTPFVVSIMRKLLRGRPRLHAITVVPLLLLLVSSGGFSGHIYTPYCLWQEELEVVHTIRELEDVAV